MTVVMIGNPNVGKSLVLNRLTGSNFIVSNYAGTSLELSEATLKLSNREIKIIDTPGIYSIISSGQDQRIIKDFFITYIKPHCPTSSILRDIPAPSNSKGRCVPVPSPGYVFQTRNSSKVCPLTLARDIPSRLGIYNKGYSF
jgi:hypothetical protein